MEHQRVQARQDQRRDFDAKVDAFIALEGLGPEQQEARNHHQYESSEGDGEKTPFDLGDGIVFPLDPDQPEIVHHNRRHHQSHTQ
jgi:hypothetical protein